jgi:hypothetical protein
MPSRALPRQPFDSTARVAAGRAPGSHPPVCRASVPLFDAATLSHRWPVARPEPAAFLRKGTADAAAPPAKRAPPPPRAPVRPPRAGGFDKRDNPPNTLFRVLYERGDIPVCVEHGGSLSLKWRVDPASLDVVALLPIFLDGIRETEDPYRFLAVRGAQELLAVAGERALAALPELVQPLRRALVTRDRAVVATASLLLQALVHGVPGAGEALVPYYRQLLPTLRLFARGAPHAGDGHAYGQRFLGPRNLTQIVDDTLALLHRSGGPHALANIVYLVPTFTHRSG